MEKRLQSAWLPITPRGVAAFASARAGRLWLVQLVVALVAGALIGWFVNFAWFSVVREALQQFPESGDIRMGHLNWADESPRILAEGHFLAFSVDEKNSATVRSPAHVQIEFGNDRVRVHSLFGYAESFYPSGWIPFNRTKLQPGWGAWRPMLVAGVVISVFVGLMISWTFLAMLYLWPVWLVGFFANRDLGLRASWRLAGAALMPGALFLIFTIVIYALGLLDVVQLFAGFIGHFVVSWVYLIVAPFFVPSRTAVATNPFKTPQA